MWSMPETLWCPEEAVAVSDQRIPACEILVRDAATTLRKRTRPILDVYAPLCLNHRDNERLRSRTRCLYEKPI
jgi:hypothetical protein